LWERVSEPSDEKPHLVIQQIIFFKIRFDLIERDRERNKGPESIALVRRIALWIGRRKPLKGIGHPHRPGGITIYLQNTSHENGCPPSPDTRFNEIAGHLTPKKVGDAELQIVQPPEPDHGFRLQRPIPSLRAIARVN